MILILKKALAFIKSYWYVPVAIGVGLFLYLLTRKKVGFDLVKIFESASLTHKKELAAIEAAHQGKLAADAAALERSKQVEIALRAEYARDLKEITAEKEKEIKHIIKQHKDDPNALAKAIEKQTGYKVFIL